MKRLAVALMLSLSPAAAVAEPWPERATPFVNDYAEIITPGAETRIAAALEGLGTETGVDATVLTLRTRAGFGPAEIPPDFASQLFLAWGMGKAEAENGILLLVALEDRYLRIVLGDGYDRGFGPVAQEIIDTAMIPAFEAGRFSDGLEDGVRATIARIARPGHAGAPPDGGR